MEEVGGNDGIDCRDEHQNEHGVDDRHDRRRQGISEDPERGQLAEKPHHLEHTDQPQDIDGRQ